MLQLFGVAGLKCEDDPDHLTVQLEHMSSNTLNYLTNGFHVAVRLISNRSQMASKCGEIKKMGSVEYGVYKTRLVGNAGCRTCRAWKTPSVENVDCGKNAGCRK